MTAARASREPRWPGLFVVLEGIDGAGTTTQLERLSAKLREEGHRVLTTREPSNGPVGALLRRALQGQLQRDDGPQGLSPQTLALLFAADRTDHLEAELVPALHQGAVVICDRYLLSSLAYQGAQLPTRWVDAINAWAMPPDLTLFLEVKPEVASRRRASRGGQAELFEDDELQARISKQYSAAIKTRAKTDQIVRIVGERSIEEVTQAALEAIHRRLQPAPAPRKRAAARR
jgi:dTMP kinase